MNESSISGISGLAYDHAVHPRHHGPLMHFEGHARVTGPCGDTMEFWLAVRDDKIDQIGFTTDGCGPSTACGSMTADLAKGAKIDAVTTLRPEEVVSALGGFPQESVHCATLAVATVKAACTDYLNRRSRGSLDHPETSSRNEKQENTDGPASTQGRKQIEKERQDKIALQSRLSRIRHQIVVLSGKGGVGKSTIAVNLAMSLVMAGKQVGLLDIDIHGPSVPTMLGLEGSKIHGSDEGMLPVMLGALKVMSLGFLLGSPDDAVIWRGPKKAIAIKQLLKDVAWGDLGYLIIDAPPGTGDEPLSVCQLSGSLDGAVIVTTPQKVAAVDVRKCITFCRKLSLPVLGVVENMSGFACPKCGTVTQIFPTGEGRRLSEDMGVPFLGSIPMDPKIAESGDNGRTFVQHYAATPTAAIMREILGRLIANDSNNITPNDSITTTPKENDI